MQSRPFHSFSQVTITAAMILVLAASGCKSAPPAPDDNALNTALQTRLTSDTAIGTEPIQTFVQGGVATLQGSVSSEAAKALAASDASQVAGIKSVVNQLSVQTVQATAPPQEHRYCPTRAPAHPRSSKQACAAGGTPGPATAPAALCKSCTYRAPQPA